MSSISLLGPSGGGGGGPFDDFKDRFQNNGLGFPSIVTLQVNAGATLDHLRVTYLSPELAGEPDRGLSTVQHGASNGGGALPPFILSGEKLVIIEGWLNIFNGTLQVCGLRFTTSSNRQSGVLGSSTDHGFNYQAPFPGGEIVILFGREGLFLDALGVYVRVT